MSYVVERSNENRLCTSSGKLGLICPICGLKFETYAAWAKKANVCCCSRACAAEARKVRIITTCVACGKEMEQTPSDAARITTCCKACSSIRRMKNGSEPARQAGTAIYQEAAKRIAKAEKCARCGVKHGPWSVVGLRFSWDRGTPTMVHDGELWCRHCHIKHASELGVKAAREKKKGDGHA